MNTKEEILQFLRNNKNFIREKFRLTKIGLFGSFARGDQKSNSDVDILIERMPDAKNIFDSYYELRELLKKQFNREVDICTEKYIKPYFKPYILRDAIYV